MVLPVIRRDYLSPLAHPAICHPPAQDHTMHHLTNNVYQLSSPYYYFLFFFVGGGGLLHHMVCGILVPRLGIEPASPALEAQGLNHWTTRKVQHLILSHLE